VQIPDLVVGEILTERRQPSTRLYDHAAPAAFPELQAFRRGV
jgi:hypothetical protein